MSCQYYLMNRRKNCQLVTQFFIPSLHYSNCLRKGPLPQHYTGKLNVRKTTYHLQKPNAIHYRGGRAAGEFINEAFDILSDIEVNPPREHRSTTFWTLITLGVVSFIAQVKRKKFFLLIHILPLPVTRICCQMSSVCRRCIALPI